MKTLEKLLTINYLGIKETVAIESIIEDKFSRLKQVFSSIQTCQIKVANIAFNSELSVNCFYLVSVSLRLLQGVELYSLRLPPGSQDSLKRAISKSTRSVIADVFAQTFRQLIELRVEEKYLLHS